MKKQTTSQAKIFNIDTEAKKLYPKIKPNYETNDYGSMYVKDHNHSNTGCRNSTFATLKRIAA